MSSKLAPAIVSFVLVGLLLASNSGHAADAIPGIGPAGEIVKLHTGLRFTEGPAADAQGVLYFTDVPAGKVLRSGANGELTTILENSQGANGLMFDAQGRLIACQGGEGRIVAIDPKNGDIQVVAGEHDGKKFNRPNDLVLDQHGGVYFTDPQIGRGPQGVSAVYYIAADGSTTRLIDDLSFPNGILLSTDEKTLYVLPYASPALVAYPILSPGKLGDGKELCKVTDRPSGFQSGGDGLTVDTKGNLYLTAPSLKAVRVVSPGGESLGLIELPEAPSNCAFGGADMKTLFVTAQKSVYAVPMDVAGHRFAAGQ